MNFELSQIDNNWSLFLDRDGVINFENEGTYVRNWSEFKFFPDTAENIAFFNLRFQKLFIATNQRGVTRNIMSVDDLDLIHRNMLEAIELKGGRIDKIYYCLDMEPESPCRKPNPGMALQAFRDFPMIDLNKSIMVGNNLSDMQFGRNAGMKTVFVQTTSPDLPLPDKSIDHYFADLDSFAKALRNS